MRRLSAFAACVLCVCGAGLATSAEPGPWATYRGNLQRTGNTDGKPGPKQPAVLWAMKSKDNFIREVLSLIHNDPSFGNELYARYLSRV